MNFQKILNSMSIGEITFECNMIVKVTVLHINFHWKKIKLLFNVLGEIIGTACTDLSLPVWSHHFFNLPLSIWSLQIKFLFLIMLCLFKFLGHKKLLIHSKFKSTWAGMVSRARMSTPASSSAFTLGLCQSISCWIKRVSIWSILHAWSNHNWKLKFLLVSK